LLNISITIQTQKNKNTYLKSMVMILTETTIMLDDYFKTNPGVKDLPRLGIQPQPSSPQSDAITIRPWRPQVSNSQWYRLHIRMNYTYKLTNIHSFVAFISVSWIDIDTSNFLLCIINYTYNLLKKVIFSKSKMMWGKEILLSC